jgi:6-pyruvoyltetrahydropterin/6-carboxytetrahydropterin synthase
VVRLSRTIHFNSGRSLWRKDWSEGRNRAVYGDEGPHGYGHNFALEVSVEGPIDPESEMVVNLTDLDRILKEEVDAPLDHRNLNLDVPEFADIPPTAENLAVWIWRRVAARIEREGWPCRLASLRLRLTPDFAVEIERDPAEE